MASGGRTQLQQPLTDCPACKTPIYIELALDIVVGELELNSGKAVNLPASIIGARIAHNCIPQVARGG